MGNYGGNARFSQVPFVLPKQPGVRAVVWITVRGLFNDTSSPSSYVAGQLDVLDGAGQSILTLFARIECNQNDIRATFVFAPGVTLGGTFSPSPGAGVGMCPFPTGFIVDSSHTIQLTGFSAAIAAPETEVEIFWQFKDAV